MNDVRFIYANEREGLRLSIDGDKPRPLSFDGLEALSELAQRELAPRLNKMSPGVAEMYRVPNTARR